MNDTQLKDMTDDLDDYIDLEDFLGVLYRGKWIIASIFVIFSIISVIFSLSLPNIYQSKALLVPVETNERVSSPLSSYGSLASIAGINFLPQLNEGNALKALEKANSLSFFEKNILQNIFLPNLMAVDYWDASTNRIIFDDEIYDASSNKWVRDFSYPQTLIPSAQESFRSFRNNHLTINLDDDTGFITIGISHQSPYIAKAWTELFVSEINDFYKLKDKTEAEKAVDYLNTEISKANFTEIKEVVAGLLQQEKQKLTLIAAKEFYVFEYIDPPAVMEKKSKPNRLMICILGAFLGGILGTLLVIIRHYLFRERN